MGLHQVPSGARHIQVGGGEDDDSVVCQVYHDKPKPLQKRILQVIAEVCRQRAGKVTSPRNP